MATKPLKPDELRAVVEEQIAVSERLAALGTLAAGVAHEINNPLAFIMANVDFVIAELKEAPTEVRQALDESRVGLDRIRHIVADLNAFARPMDEGTMSVDVRACVEWAIRVTTNEIRHRAQLVRRLDEVPPVLAVLPAATPNTAIAQKAKAKGPGQTERARVLVIDDDPLVGRAMARLLHGHAVTVVASAADGIRLIQAHQHFDLILCDLMMPEATGMDFHESMLVVAPEEAERVVFLTGGAFTARAQEFVTSVPNLVLRKPIEREAIEAILQSRVRERLCF